MRFTFDPRKRAANLRKHGLDLADAQVLLASVATVTFKDRRLDYGEDGFLTIAPMGERLVTIVTMETAAEIRVISMRKATRTEKAIYREHSRQSAR